MTLCIILSMLFLVLNSDTVTTGASIGLMLWFQNVLPLLLPFMLLSSLLTNQLSSRTTKSTSIFLTILLGLFCGYPLGAKTINDCISKSIYQKRTGNLLLPLCNQSSPMFLSGFVLIHILHKSISLFTLFLLIYTPYIFYFFITLTSIFKIEKSSSTHTVKPNDINPETSSPSDTILQCIIQITSVGVYIMLCSIIFEFASKLSFPFINILVGSLEITRGLSYIETLHPITENVFNFSFTINKTALILALTSFGGISSILQTKSVTTKSGLSICYYIAIKTLCAITTYILTAFILA